MDEVRIRIPESLYREVETMVKDTGFSTVEDFILYVLRDLISSGTLKEDPSLTREEVDEVRKRLEALGYLK
jgi:Arc/MetJ-type ribon-helix-helix transcriptional regulator